jgi:hypothetical protein
MPIDPQLIRPGQGIDLDQTENSLKLLEAIVTLREQKLATFREKGKRERDLIGQFFVASKLDLVQPDEQGYIDIAPRVVRGYLEAHKAYEEAEAQLMEIELARAKSDAAILAAALQEARDPRKVIASSIKM